MKKLTQLVLMLCLILSGALCYAGGVDGTGNEKGNDGMPISVIKKAGHSSPDKGMSIHASIDGHYLTVAFTENLGQVAIEITTASGGLCGDAVHHHAQRLAVLHPQHRGLHRQLHASQWR